MHKISNRSDQVIVTVYPQGTGGKFILNCLALGKGFLLQDQQLALQQINDQLDSQGVIALLLARIVDTKASWHDLGLGDQEFFGQDFLTQLHSTNPVEKLPDIVHQALNNGFKIPAVAHTKHQLFRLLEVFSDAKIVAFINTGNFYHYRYNDINVCWKQIKGPDWPIRAPESKQEFDLFPEWVRNEITRDFGFIVSKLSRPLSMTVDEIEQQYTQALINHKNFTWDCGWFYGNDADFVHNCRELYDYVQISGFCADRVLKLRCAWLDKLKELRDG